MTGATGPTRAADGAGVPRVLAIMGSGETAPAMARVHRALFDRLGGPAPAAILDTPYGFQENADELSARTVEFFATSVGVRVEVASYRSRAVDAVSAASALGRLRGARYVMAGPGSPSYALRHWAGGPIPATLAEKLATGGVLTMASAAALTLGVVTIPVYEIYKVGEPPHWLEGLDILGRATGLRAAVVPHYDNAEGGHHDTRFCYMGERRLAVLEAALPDGAFVLGVDSHTALLLDLVSGSASVEGLGGATVRVGGRSARFGAGSTVAIAAIAEAAGQLASGSEAEDVLSVALAGGTTATARRARGPSAPLREEMQDLEGAFVAALGSDDLRAATAALLALDEAIETRMRHGEDSAELDSATATFRSLVVRLAERAEAGLRGPGPGLDVLATTLVGLRDRARAARDWATADLIRDRLAEAGIEVRDGTDGSRWEPRGR